METLHEEIGPLVFFPGRYGIMSIKISGDIQEGLAQIEKVWKEFVPEGPFVFDFLDVRSTFPPARDAASGRQYINKQHSSIVCT